VGGGIYEINNPSKALYMLLNSEGQ